MFDPIREPTKPYAPVIIPRRRPVPVTVAVTALLGAGVAGILAALALLGAAGMVVDDFRSRVVDLGVSPGDAWDISGALRTALLTSGCAAFALAAVSLPLARGVLHRREASRIGALIVAGAGLTCGLVRTSVTAFGARVDWATAAGHRDPSLDAAVAQAVGDAMPGWLVGLGGGLTDLQSLGYIAVAAMLVVPSSREYFRSRILWYADQLE